MTHAINKCSANETAACCCVDVGTVMDNTDCTASWNQLYATHQQAAEMLNQLTEKARQIESEPCVIDARFTEQPTGVELEADFTFSCQVETMIFQLSLR